MPELPEITHLAAQMKQHLAEKTIRGVEVLQEKCLNISVGEFAAALQGAQILDASNRGKWIWVETTRGWLLLNLGMGGEVLLTSRDHLPEKHRIVFDFEDGTCLSVNFWWFGYTHFVPLDGLSGHAMTARLGPNALAVSPEDLKHMLLNRRGQIKSFLLDQSHLAGIGNAYIHDILFFARLHPQHRIETLTDQEIESLARAIHLGLAPSLEKGGAFYEVDLFGQNGGFTVSEIKIGYREGEPCPTCGTLIQKIKTGSTSSFICPTCQV